MIMIMMMFMVMILMMMIKILVGIRLEISCMYNDYVVYKATEENTQEKRPLCRKTNRNFW